MSSVSSIEWTDATWNPTTGCTKVSPGCGHCYIERTPPFRIGDRPFVGGKGPDSIGAMTKGGVVLHPDRLDQPLRWRKPRRVFVNSLSDLFHDDVPLRFIALVFAVMAEAPQHKFQVLTKRPRRMRDLLTSEGFWQIVDNASCDLMDVEGVRLLEDNPWSPRVGMERGLPNVWLGVSVENQEWADKRIPLLLETPAAVRFLSCEPLLGPVDLCNLAGRGPAVDSLRGDVKDRDGVVYAACPGSVHWVIVGGESGRAARPMHPDWARSLRDRCLAAGVPFFFKQWGEWGPADEHPELDVSSLAVVEEPPGSSNGDSWMARAGKKATGRELDGRTWDEMPGKIVA